MPKTDFYLKLPSYHCLVKVFVTVDFYKLLNLLPSITVRGQLQIELTSKRVCLSCKKGEIGINDIPTYGRCSECPTTALIPAANWKLQLLLKFKQNDFF